MEELRKLLSFNKRERVAIIGILAVILVLVLACVFHRPRVSLDEASLHNLDSLWTLHQNAIAEQQQNTIVNPATEEKGRRATSSISKPTRNTTRQTETTAPTRKAIPIVDLNTVDSLTLVELPQIGPYTAVRIIELRDKLGGFVDKEQLREVKGMDSVRFAIMEPYIIIGDAQPKKVDVNRDDFKTLVHHPYLNYEQVKRIVNHREKRGMIKNWAQLEALIKDEGEIHPLLERYVKF